MVSTDDAYVGADTTTLATKISGYVAAVAVDDNQQVHAGDVIATIDDGDYRLAVDAARNKVATQKATINRIAKQVAAQQAAVDQAKAQLTSAEAGFRLSLPGQPNGGLFRGHAAPSRSGPSRRTTY